MLKGQIIKIQDNASKPRIILKLDSGLLSKQKLPHYVRLNISHEAYQILRPYDIITGTAFLAPPAEPSFKGAYNFKFYARLMNLGATGQLKKINHHKVYQGYSLKNYVHNLRIKIADNIHKNLSKEIASPIIAMITGSRFDIPETIESAWKSSGIYHLLSISGLHTTIIAGLSFLAIRYFLLLFPVLRYGNHVKKITALSVIPIVYGYVLLSGGAVPVMRSYIMVCVGLVAILCDQRVVTIRSACVAFCIILAINPPDIFNIGFGLSFVAVFGIIIMLNFIKRIDEKYHLSSFKKFILINIGAGYAGIPLVLYSFGLYTSYSLIANFFAVPLASFIVMPLIVLSTIAMIFDWHFYPLQLLGVSIKTLNYIALTISELPFSMIYFPTPQLIWVIIFYSGLYLVAINISHTIKVGIMLIIIALLGYKLSPKLDYLEINNKKMIYYLNHDAHLIRLVQYDKAYYNSFLHAQIMQQFGLNPNHVFYHQECQYRKTYITLSGKKFQCF